MPKITLSHRMFLSVSGSDAEDFLQGLVTTDLASLETGEARPGALLTPQGKVLFDFLIARSSDEFQLETDKSQSESLIKRLTMYKLRAKVTIAATDDTGASIIWGEAPLAGALRDARFAKAGIDLWRSLGGHGFTEDRTAYDALRVDHGIAESGFDFALSDAFPHDVMLDLNGGVSFKKGCYVGQEVVSRMQHRSTARRRIVIQDGSSALPASGTDLLCEGKVVGTLGTVCGTRGLALARIDRIGDAMARNVPVTAGDVVVTARLALWTGLTFPQSTDEASA